MYIIDNIKNFIKNIFINKNDLIENAKTYEDELFTQYGECKQNKVLNLKILFIADTHDCLNYEKETLEYIKNIKEYDYCILLGDHSANDLREITQIIPQNKICGVLGNHDSWDKYDELGIENIGGKIKEIKGVKIAGISGSFKYKNSDQYALYTHDESIELASKMPYADILVSHDKPYTKKQFGDAHDGLKGITKYLFQNHIPLHIHGHLHEPGEEILKNGTKSICLYKVNMIKF